MPGRTIRVKIDPLLLEKIDRDPEVRNRGRSAFIQSAVELYLKEKRRREIDVLIERAYAGRADEILEEVADLVASQKPARDGAVADEDLSPRQSDE